MNKEDVVKIWQDLGEKAASFPCPRCGHLRMDKDLYHNALSRRINVCICSQCGTDEAIEDFGGRKKPVEDWFLFSDIFRLEKQFENRNEYILNVQRELHVTAQDIDDIMVGALEGGINYWCRKAEVAENDYYGEYASEQISRGGSLILYDSEEDATYILNLNKLLNGIILACKDGFGDGWFDGDNLDCGMIDAIGCDIIVQYALFGEVVFG